MPLIQYAAGFSALTRLQWNEDGLDIQIDSVKGSMMNQGNQEIPTWKPDENPSNPIGPDPGSSNVYKNDGDGPSDGKIPQSLGKRPYTLFDADQVLVCATEEDDDKDGVVCGRVDLCEAGLFPCPSEIGVNSRPPRTSTSRRDSGIDLLSLKVGNDLQLAGDLNREADPVNDDV